MLLYSSAKAYVMHTLEIVVGMISLSLRPVVTDEFWKEQRSRSQSNGIKRLANCSVCIGLPTLL